MKFFICSCLLLVFCSQGYAVDDSRLWLPKKYRAAMPKLQAVARQAEQTRRCVTVLSGKMMVTKNTADHYHFVVTCRDKDAKSYNLSYLSPIAGSAPQLISEQGRGISKTGGAIDVAANSPELEQCLDAMHRATVDRAGVTILDEEITGPVVQQGGAVYMIPFTTRSEQGQALRYLATCRPDKTGGSDIAIELQSDGAVLLCQDELSQQTLLLKAVQVVEGATARHWQGDRYTVEIPFLAENLLGNQRQFKAYCQVDGQHEVELTTGIDPETVVSVCIETIAAKAGNMNKVEILKEPAPTMVERDGEYSGVIFFDASSPSGRRLHFQADCDVDSMGRSRVSMGSRQP